MIKEFREFINRGNLVDLAVAFVLGAAFASLVTSFTENIIDPILGRLFALDNLADWTVWEMRLGAFAVAVANFIIIGFVIFLMVKAYNRYRKRRQAEEEAAPEEPSEEILLLREIRDGVRPR